MAQFASGDDVSNKDSNSMKQDKDLTAASSMSWNTDQSSCTSEDELITSMMADPIPFENCLIPERFETDKEALEHLVVCLNHRFQSSPAVFIGSLEEAVKESFANEIAKRSPLIIYVNHDRSIFSNLFNKVLCNHVLTDYLMTNFIMWAWDITFNSNAQRLSVSWQKAFGYSKANINVVTCDPDRYPLLLGIYRNLDGYYNVDILHDGSMEIPNVNTIHATLFQFKEKFHLRETDLEKHREARRLAFLENLEMQKAKMVSEKMYFRSISMRDPSSNQIHGIRHKFDRMMTTSGKKKDFHRLLSIKDDHRTEQELKFFEAVEKDSDDGDIEDENDDNETPTVERENPIF